MKPTRKAIVGYADNLSVENGHVLRFMVSTDLPSYHAELVRLHHGDENPQGPGFKESVVASAIARDYQGRLQTIRCGSCVRCPPLPPMESFTMHAWVYLTVAEDPARPPAKPVQGIMASTGESGGGFALVLGEDASLELRLGSLDQYSRVRTGVPLLPHRWYSVAAMIDGESHEATVVQAPLEPMPREEPAPTGTTLIESGEWGGDPLLLGALTRERVTHAGEGHLNGKIEDPCVIAGALSLQELEQLRNVDSAATSLDAVVAAWDMSLGIDTVGVTDTSGNERHGICVNMPARAVAGRKWTGNVHAWQQAPEEYGAIHFHDDDLEDCEWDVDFELAVRDLPSGVYAARLTSDDHEDHIPFFVRPTLGAPTASVLVVASSATYLAYAGDRPEREIEIDDGPVSVLSEDRWNEQHRTRCLYDRHSDGSPVCYSSRLRPLLNLRPKYRYFWEDIPHNLAADLYVMDWLDARGYPYNVATDEDLDRMGVELLRSYQVVITGSHPEYASERMVDAYDAYLDGGGKMMYLGGNGFGFVCAFHKQRPNVVEIRRSHGDVGRAWVGPGEAYLSTTGELGGNWCYRGKGAFRLTGVDVAAVGYRPGRPYDRAAESFDPAVAFIFDGVDRDEPIGDFGLQHNAAAGVEVDAVSPRMGTPPQTRVLARATGFSPRHGWVGPWIDPWRYSADLVFIERRNGGAVFSASSMTWTAALSHNAYENNVSRITENLLRRFLQE